MSGRIQISNCHMMLLLFERDLVMLFIFNSRVQFDTGFELLEPLKVDSSLARKVEHFNGKRMVLFCCPVFQDIFDTYPSG